MAIKYVRRVGFSCHPPTAGSYLRRQKRLLADKRGYKGMSVVMAVSTKAAPGRMDEAIEIAREGAKITPNMEDIPSIYRALLASYRD